MKVTQLTTLAVLLTVSPVSQAWDLFGGSGNQNNSSTTNNAGTYLNGKETSAQSEAQMQVLKSLQTEMTFKFNQIEAEIAKGNTQAALSMAKSVLDNVKIKTGIDPKNKIQEKFLIPTKFPANAKSMDNLSEDQKELVIRTISEYRGGLYLDIMNLSKRTTLLYIKAFQAQLTKGGKLTNADKEKIVNDLVKASLIPMPLEDKSRNRITIFDEDVANEDHIYLFNRELMMSVIENKDLNLTEADFENKKIALKKSLGGNVVTKKDENSMGVPSELYEGYVCNQNALLIPDLSDRYRVQYACFNKHYERSTSMSNCTEFAAKTSYYKFDLNEQTLKCFKKFN